MTTGHANGKAIALGFPDYDMSNPYDAGVNQRISGKKTMGDLGLNPNEPILLDSSGMDRAYYDSINGLKEFVFRAQRDFGVDLMSAPDPSNPKAQELFDQFNQAYSTHMRNTERLKQGKQMQEFLKKEWADGNLHGRSSREQMMYGDVQDTQWATKNPLIQEVNDQLKRAPKSAEEAAQMNAYREEVLASIDARAETGEIPVEAAREYKAQIAPPVGYDDRLIRSKLGMDEENRKLAKARRGTEYAKQKELGKRHKKTYKSAKEVVSAFPELRKVAEFITTGNGKSGPANFDHQYFQGRKMRGDKNGREYVTMARGGNGDDSYFIQFSKEKKKTTDLGDVIENDTKDIQFNRNDILPAIEATLTNNEFSKLKQSLNEFGMLEDGKVSADEIMKLHDPYYTLRDLDPKQFRQWAEEQGYNREEGIKIWNIINPE